jgi:hypothetical protein
MPLTGLTRSRKPQVTRKRRVAISRCDPASGHACCVKEHVEQYWAKGSQRAVRQARVRGFIARRSGARATAEAGATLFVAECLPLGLTIPLGARLCAGAVRISAVRWLR